MKTKLSTLAQIAKEVFYEDHIDIYLFGSTIAVFVADFFIWRWRLRFEDIYIFTINGVYPIRFLGIILLVNTILAIFSYEREREISYLLFGSGLTVSLFVLILEIFYLVNLNYGP